MQRLKRRTTTFLLQTKGSEIHAIQSGIVYGFAGLTDSMIELTQNELGETLTVVATGGTSQIIAPLTKNIKHVELLLTLNGLAEISSIIDK